MLNKVIRYLTNKKYRFDINASRFGYKRMSDEEFLKIKYRNAFGRDLALLSPNTFNEKLQWLKLNDRNPIYTKLVDKYEVKEYVGNIIGKEHVIPTIGVWDSFDQIDFFQLPNQFVIKCTHDSGGVIVCKDKKNFNYKEAKQKINKCLKRNYFFSSREWPYKNVKPRIIAEQYMEDSTGTLQDYKIHCFNGEPKFILVCRDRFSTTGLTEDFFDVEWNHLDVKRPGNENSKEKIQVPKTLKEMLELSALLSASCPFLRVDFYEVDGKIYFGELTFYPASGFERFIPDKWDKTFGDWIDLSAVKKEK